MFTWQAEMVLTRSYALSVFGKIPEPGELVKLDNQMELPENPVSVKIYGMNKRSGLAAFQKKLKAIFR